VIGPSGGPLSILILVATLAGCIATENHPAIAIEAASGAGGVEVTGTTDLPDGAAIEIAAWPGCPGTDADPDAVAHSQLSVQDGGFDGVLSLRPAAEGDVSVSVTFVPGDIATQDRYGLNGEKLSGDGVFEDVGLRLYRRTICVTL
jgi:hypothetical protein